MSNTKNNSLVFPSGKTVAQIKKDAKQLKKSEGISTATALDILTKQNGMHCSYKDAVEALKEAGQRKIKPEDNEANQQNPNKGTKGTNRQHDQVQGNRSKQLLRVTFLAPKGLLPEAIFRKYKLEKLKPSTAIQQKLISSTNSILDNHTNKYDFIRFQNPIKGGANNTSGALLKIRAVMSGQYEHKQSPTFWIGTRKHEDNQHPDNENAIDYYWTDGTEYNPFMYE